MESDFYTRKAVGRIGEDTAATFLVRKGFKILDRNYRKPCGEIDIIAEKDGIVRFVEVKTLARVLLDVSREMSRYRPEEQVHSRKLAKICRTADMYMHTRKDVREYQVDVVGVYLDTNRRIARCRLFEQVL